MSRMLEVTALFALCNVRSCFFFVSNIAMKVLQNQLMLSVLPATAGEIKLHVRIIR